ncbi:MAG: thiamine pyrophosphate-binding protein, partial [Acidobacteriota bacterium]
MTALLHDARAAALQTAWARLAIGTLADAGITHAVASPGSRSTPLRLALRDEPRIATIDLIDERDAAYFALGVGRATGRPAVVLSTSGTAVANHLPAVVEAGAARVPLLLLTADRPPGLVESGANQTIDQLKLFGDHARAFVDLGVPDARPDALRGLRRAIARAVFTARDPAPGAVHLNARLWKPLEPPVVDGAG